MAIFSAFATAVAMDHFFNPVEIQGPSGLPWSATVVIESFQIEGRESVSFTGWPYSASAPQTPAGLFVIEGQLTNLKSKSLAKISGNVNRILEIPASSTSGFPYWEVYVEDGVALSDMRADGTLGNTLRRLFSGNDIIYGSTESDSLYGFKGDDKLYGYEGSDLYYVDSAGDRVIEAKNGGTGDVVYTYVSWSAQKNPNSEIENIYCIERCVNVEGTDTDNVLLGNEANNQLFGKRGNDLILAVGEHPYQNNVTPEAKIFESDSLSGGEGNDIIFGFGGADKISGGYGADIIIFNTAPNNDVAEIRNFSPSKDRIGLVVNKAYRKIKYNAPFLTGVKTLQEYNKGALVKLLGIATLQATEYQVITGSTKIEQGKTTARIIYDKDSGDIYYDADASGDGKPRRFARLVPAVELKATNIIAVDESRTFPGVYQ